MKKKQVKKKEPTQTIISCDIHLKTLSKLTRKQAEVLCNGASEGKLICFTDVEDNYELQVTYPFVLIHKFDLARENIDYVGGLFWEIAQCYKKLYRAPVKNKIWGHGFEDLALEGVIIDHGKQIITLNVGS